MTLKLISPAKINLFLRVVGRRPDGYHELASLFQTISLVDKIHFNLADNDTMTCTDLSLPLDGSNLVMKAVNLFRRKTGLNFGVRVHLEKNIPSQAGLGGGSSNAATTLWALNQLHNNIATTGDLQTWSAEIGSDIPFFFSHGTAYCTGRGEIVNDLPAPVRKTKVAIFKPAIGLPTPSVYARLRTLTPQDHLTTPSEDLQLFLDDKPRYCNDLEAAAFMEEPALQILKQNLLSFDFDTVLMTGSGSAFFCLGNSNTVPSEPFFQAEFISRSNDEWYQEL